MATATAIFSTDLASTFTGADAKAPDWIEVFPAGPVIKARDGREFTADPAAVLAAFATETLPLAIDYEHGQAHQAPKGEEAPAAGWIKKLEERAGAIWALVDWTARAAKMIVEREYRFVSPEFTTDRKGGGRIQRLVGAGLVNRPAFEMTALSRAQPQEEPTMKNIAKHVGLAETASEEAIVAVLGKRDEDRTALCAALKIDAAADQAAVLAAIGKLQGDAAGDKTELAAVKASLGEATTKIAALQKAEGDRAIDAALDAAAREGKITPATREGYKAMCAVEGGLERFKALAKTLPVIADPSQLAAATTDDGKVEGDPVEIAQKARDWQDEQATKYGRHVSIAAAVAHVTAEKAKTQ